MVAIFPAERVAPRRDHARPTESTSRTRQYDSFLLRLWHDGDDEGMLRVELEHVQAGLSVGAVKVPLDWIVPEILGCLESSRSPQAAAMLDSSENGAEVV